MKNYNSHKNLLSIVVKFATSLTEKKLFTSKNFERLQVCGDFLWFLADKTMQHLKLNSGSFCNLRLCPICSWRKSKKDALKISVLLSYIHQTHKKEFLFLTLTAPNVRAEELAEEITHFNKSFKRLIERKVVASIVKGYIRKLEITYNKKTDTYHPHFHVIIAVNKSYFTHRSYLTQATWQELWQQSTRATGINIVDVRRVKTGLIAAEVAKEVKKIAGYSAKNKHLMKYSKEVFEVFYKALKSRQVITYHGFFADANKLYKNGELDYLKEKDLNEYAYMLLYKWGYSEYVEAEKRELNEREIKKFNRQLLDEIDDDD